LGDDKPCDIVGKGKMMINLENGNQWLLKEVKHVPYLRKNIILTRWLGSEGSVSTFIDKKWKVTKGAPVVEKDEKVGTLYLCNGNVDSSISLASKGIYTMLWNKRHGHMSEKSAYFPIQKNISRFEAV
jgi:hypothetical protein